MELRCPECGVGLEVGPVRMTAPVQCPACDTVFRAAEGALRSDLHAGEVIDVHAEVLSPDDPLASESIAVGDGAADEYAVEPVRLDEHEYPSDDVPEERVLYLERAWTARSNNGCGCSGCGCLLVILLLLLLLLF